METNDKTKKIFSLQIIIILIIIPIVFSSCQNKKANSNGMEGVYYLNAVKTDEKNIVYNDKNFAGAIEIGRFTDTKKLYVRELKVAERLELNFFNRFKIPINSRIVNWESKELMYKSTSILEEKQKNQYYFRAGVSRMMLTLDGGRIIISNIHSNDYFTYYKKFKGKRPKKISEKDYHYYSNMEGTIID